MSVIDPPSNELDIGDNATQAAGYFKGGKAVLTRGDSRRHARRTAVRASVDGCRTPGERTTISAMYWHGFAGWHGVVLLLIGLAAIGVVVGLIVWAVTSTNASRGHATPPVHPAPGAYPPPGYPTAPGHPTAPGYPAAPHQGGPPGPPVTPPTPPAPPTIEARLAQLDALHVAGTITDEERQARRAAIIAEI
ncbi:hypothetical protein ACGGZK_12460 [Agromyces sp. MMS24-K17]|uniref:hypothetical protein n=1 Tax=Agromyces sp. MMS24-K17 TaxID=3372850 RepID=UPI0037552583